MKIDFDSFPKISIAGSIVSLIWIVISFWHWAFMYPDVSQLIFAVCFGLLGFYISYDHWHKTVSDRKYMELERICDTFLNWKIKHEGEKHDKEV